MKTNIYSLIFVLTFATAIMAESKLILFGGEKHPAATVESFAKMIKDSGGSTLVMAWDEEGNRDEDELEYIQNLLIENGIDKNRLSVAPKITSLEKPRTIDKLVSQINAADAFYIAENQETQWAKLLSTREIADAMDAKLKSGAILAGAGTGIEHLGSILLRNGGDKEDDLDSLDNPTKGGNPNFLDYPTKPGSNLLKDHLIDTHFHEDPRQVYRLVASVLKGESNIAYGLPVRSGLTIDKDQVRLDGYGMRDTYQGLMIKALPNKKGALVKILKPGNSYSPGLAQSQLECTESKGRVAHNAKLILEGMAFNHNDGRQIVQWMSPKKGKVLSITWAHDSTSVLHRWAKNMLTEGGLAEERILFAPSYDEMLTQKGVNTFLEQLNEAEGIVMGGGDQGGYLDIIFSPSPMHLPLREKLMQKLHGKENSPIFYAGASAGTAFASDGVFSGAAIQDNRDPFRTELRPGIPLVKGVIFDSHFHDRPGRLKRLIGGLRESSALGYTGANMAIGIGERSALVIENGRLKVIGSEPVMVVNRVTPDLFKISLIEPGKEFSFEDCSLVGRVGSVSRARALIETPKLENQERHLGIR